MLQPRTCSYPTKLGRSKLKYRTTKALLNFQIFKDLSRSMTLGKKWTSEKWAKNSTYNFPSRPYAKLQKCTHMKQDAENPRRKRAKKPESPRQNLEFWGCQRELLVRDRKNKTQFELKLPIGCVLGWSIIP